MSRKAALSGGAQLGRFVLVSSERVRQDHRRCRVCVAAEAPAAAGDLPPLVYVWRSCGWSLLGGLGGERPEKTALQLLGLPPLGVARVDHDKWEIGGTMSEAVGDGCARARGVGG